MVALFMLLVIHFLYLPFYFLILIGAPVQTAFYSVVCLM